MRPRFGSAIVLKARLRHDADRTTSATADPSRWTHRVGVAGRAREKVTPTRNAIGLSSPVGIWSTVAIDELSPWHSILPPRGGGGVFVAGESEPAAVTIAGAPV